MFTAIVTKRFCSDTDPPVVTVTAESMPNVVVNEGGEVNLECRYDSNPSSLKRVLW